MRAVLLSAIQSVLSLARQRHGYSLSSPTSSQIKKESPLWVFQSFLSLRERLPYCDNLTDLSPGTVVKPFLDVIRHEYISSTVTCAALEAVLSFLHSWPWADGKDPNVAADALAEIVDAVSHCKFQVTEMEHDQNQHVPVLVVHVLHAVVRSPLSVKLSDHSMWQLVESLYALSRRNVPVRLTATTILYDAIALIFSNRAIYSDLVASSCSSSSTPGFGLPCAVKIVGFLCQKLYQRNNSPSLDDRTPSVGGITTSRREVLLSLSLLHRVLLACDAELITNVPSLMLLIKDDLCSAILRYCRLGTCDELQITVTCLELIRLLWSKLRSELKMQVEAIFNTVFYHTLHWCLAVMNPTNPEFPRGDERAPVADDEAHEAATMVDAAFDEFSGELLPKSQLYSISFEILDCLVDLLAETTLLPDLYVNYDCDDTRCDLTQTLFDLLSQTVQQSHVACSESHEETHFLWAQAIGESALRGLFNALYVVYLRTDPETLVVTGQSSPRDVEIDKENDTLLVNQQDDDASVRADTTDRVSASVLYEKRQRKKFLKHGIQEFNRKPLAGIKYLQQNGFLPTPLDSLSFATFLRSLPQGLNKNAVGAFLGAMGKQVKHFEKTEIHEADTIDFHRDVLTNFVRSFNFEGESIVTALRMFLASFRLPGEAQQIDRILNAFSLQVYEQCRERCIMASVDVAYLLSFSLIMLNTDLHNPNIRSEKKMKVADFIKNNKNYGFEVSKGVDLPVEFLTELYNAIAKDEIKTFEDGGKHGEVTSDRWKDLVNQAESDPRHSRLIVHHHHHHPPSVQLRSSSPLPCPAVLDDDEPQTMEPMRVTPHARVSVLGSEANEAEQASVDHLYDCHIYELIQPSLVRAFSSVFHQFVADSKAKDAARTPELSVGSSYEMHYVPPKSALQLACNGLVLCAAVATHLALFEPFNAVFIRLCKYTGLLASEIYPLGYNGRVNGSRVYCDNPSAPVATAAVLKLVHACSVSLRSRAWKHFFHVVSGLREFRVLPSRMVHPNDEMALEVMTLDERRDFLDLVYENKDRMERKRMAQNAQEQTSSSGAGGFFSGVAWLLSTFDSNLGGAAPTSPRTTKPRVSLNGIQRNPAELALYTEDLVLERDDVTNKTCNEETDLKNDDASDEWIRTTLQPYRLDLLMHDVANLPSRALVEAIVALDDEIVQTLRGGEANESLSDRKKCRKLSLSQGGCVLFEHLLSQVIALCKCRFEDEDTANADGISCVLAAHYPQVLELLRPVLLTSATPHGMTYVNACVLLQKSITGLFAWAIRARSEPSKLVLVQVLGTLKEMSGDDELVRPFLTSIMCGLNRYVTLLEPKNVGFSRVDWLTICSLISWCVTLPHAANHAFRLLERLVMEEVWNTNGQEILVSDCYTKTMMFAMKTREREDAWAWARPLELLLFMFDTLRPDASNYVDERLRFLGGMTIVTRHLLWHQRRHEIPNDVLVTAMKGVKHMLRKHTGSAFQSFQPMAWLDVLRYGLLPIGFDILNEAGSRTFDNEEEEMNSPFLYYGRQLPLYEEESWLARRCDGVGGGSKDQTRPRVVTRKDPFALRPHVVVVQLLSLVVCEELPKLQTCLMFPVVWNQVAMLLVGLLEQTNMETPPSPAHGNASGELLIAALERRRVFSAHEEILEHCKGIIRRLAVLQGEMEGREKEKEEEEGGARLEQPTALMEVLEAHCRAKAGLHSQLFPSREETGSTGECTPPRDQSEAEVLEGPSDSEEAS